MVTAKYTIKRSQLHYLSTRRLGYTNGTFAGDSGYRTVSKFKTLNMAFNTDSSGEVGLAEGQ